MGRDFDSMLVEGQQYENILIDKLTKQGLRCLSTQDNKSYQDIGVDFIISYIKKKQLQTYYCEVKADSRIHKTNNVFVEVGMGRKTGYTKGWFYTCLADFIFYVDTIKHMYYVLDWHKVKKYITTSNKKIMSFYNKYDDCVGYGYLLSISELKSCITETNKL